MPARRPCPGSFRPPERGGPPERVGRVPTTPPGRERRQEEAGGWQLVFPARQHPVGRPAATPGVKIQGPEPSGRPWRRPGPPPRCQVRGQTHARALGTALAIRKLFRLRCFFLSAPSSGPTDRQVLFPLPTCIPGKASGHPASHLNLQRGLGALLFYLRLWSALQRAPDPSPEEEPPGVGFPERPFSETSHGGGGGRQRRRSPPASPGPCGRTGVGSLSSPPSSSK